MVLGFELSYFLQIRSNDLSNLHVILIFTNSPSTGDAHSRGLQKMENLQRSISHKNSLDLFEKNNLIQIPSTKIVNLNFSPQFDSIKLFDNKIEDFETPHV
ncbi:hypothetical protein ACTFIY_001103 [Dictyostelium cf. discoideum]